MLSEAHTISDEFIKLHKLMAEKTSDMKDALLKALENAAIQFSQQEEFAVKVESFQHRVLKNVDSSNLRSQSYFAKFMESMETAMQMMLGKWNTETKNVSLELSKLQNVNALHSIVYTLLNILLNLNSDYSKI